MKSMFKGALGALVVVLALCGLTAASALAAGAPIVETKPASAITGTEATLNGHLNPNGAGTKFHFEYGTTTSYGSKTLESGESTTEKTVFRRAEGLATNTTYHFRLVATNSYGTSYGADETFTTVAEKPEFAAKAGEKLTEVEFTGTFGDPGWTLSSGSISFLCNTGSFHGVVSGTKTMSGKVVFKSCGTEHFTCRSAGSAESGEIVTEQLEGTLVYISKTAKTVALNLKAKSGSQVVPLLCDGVEKAEVRGSILFPITTPVNKLSKSISFGALQLTSQGEQRLTEYETSTGEKRHSVLESNFPNVFAPVGWAIGEHSTSTNKEFEIKA